MRANVWYVIQHCLKTPKLSVSPDLRVLHLSAALALQTMMLRTLMLGVFVSVHLSVTQQLLRVRPSPSDHLPVPDLREDPNPALEPNEKDLVVRTLLRKLGGSFDRKHLSINTPASSNSSISSLLRFTGAMPSEFQDLDLRNFSNGQTLKMNSRARQKFRLWLWSYTRCPVVSAWKDLGIRFWPRYVKEGRCYNEQSCSLPGGMFCKPVKSVTVKLLRWHCQGFRAFKHCTWIHAHYPVISQCQCAC